MYLNDKGKKGGLRQSVQEAATRCQLGSFGRWLVAVWRKLVSL